MCVTRRQRIEVWSVSLLETTRLGGRCNRHLQRLSRLVRGRTAATFVEIMTLSRASDQPAESGVGHDSINCHLKRLSRLVRGRTAATFVEIMTLSRASDQPAESGVGHDSINCHLKRTSTEYEYTSHREPQVI